MLSGSKNCREIDIRTLNPVERRDGVGAEAEANRPGGLPVFLDPA